MKEKCKKICKYIPFEFSFQNYKIIFIVICPLFGVAHHRIRDKYAQQSNNNKYFNMFLYFLSHIFSSIPLLIYLIVNRIKKEPKKPKDEEDTENEELNQNQIINEEIKKIEKKDTINHILLIIFLLFVSIVFSYFNIVCNIDKKTIGLSYKILIFFLLSYFILKYKYYKHHYISLCLIILTLMTKYTLGIIQSHSEKYVAIHVWQYFLFAFLNCTFLIFGKLYMDKYQKTPFVFMFIIGIFHCVVLTIIATIKFFTIKKSYIFSGFKEYVNSKKNFGLFIADIISQFIYKFGFWVTTYYFTPLHTVISENIMEIYYIIYDYESNKKFWEDSGYTWNQYVIPTVLVLNFIFSLIFNEILILKCCKLDYYTRKRIQEREVKDSKTLLELENFGNDFDSSLNSDEKTSVGASVE